MTPRTRRASSPSPVERAAALDRSIAEAAASVTGFLPLPNAVDALCAELAGVYARANAEARAEIRDRGSVDERRIFLTFAERMAILSRREKDAARIDAALVGLVVEDGRWDPRETMLRLALLHQSAKKLGDAGDAKKAFERAARLATPATAKLLRDTAANPPSIESMGFREAERPDGFFYERGW